MAEAVKKMAMKIQAPGGMQALVHRDVSTAMRVHTPQEIKRCAKAQKRVHTPSGATGLPVRSRFATRAQAQLLDALGWRIVASPRREVEHHASLQCCFVLRNGEREEAAFGYTGMTVPSNRDDPVLRKAQSHVERLLTLLGEDRGVLIQNVPLFAFGGRYKERIAVFGGWRFQGSSWKPFLFGPDGLAGVAAQEILFARDTAPNHMAEVCGHAAKTAMPGIAELVRAIKSFGQFQATEHWTTMPGADFEKLQVMSNASGWLSARDGQSPEAAPAREVFCHVPFRKHTVECKTSWDFGNDEFRFHKFG